MKRVQQLVFVVVIAVLVASRPEAALALGAFDYWVGEAQTNCDLGFDLGNYPSPEYYAQCLCQSEGCNEYVTQEWCGQAHDACEEFCSAYYCGIHEDEFDCSGGSYYGSVLCTCFPLVSTEPPSC